VVAPKLMTPAHHAAAPAAVVRVAEPDAGGAADASQRGVDSPEPAPEHQAPAAEPTASSGGSGDGTSVSSAPQAGSAQSGKADEQPALDADPGRVNSGIPGALPDVPLPTVACVPAPEEEATVTAAEDGQEPTASAAETGEEGAAAPALNCPAGAVEPGASGEPVPTDEPTATPPDGTEPDPAQPATPDAAPTEPATSQPPADTAAESTTVTLPDGTQLPITGDMTVSTITDDPGQ
jgi:hypothetical protein